MKDLHELDFCRCRDAWVHALYGSFGDRGNGAFCVLTTEDGSTAVDNNARIDSPWLLVIASNGGDWEHLSVSVRNTKQGPRCPTWDEMSMVHRAFFKPNETAMQLHVPENEHVNLHPTTLHLWRPRRGKPIPRPPSEMVGPRNNNTPTTGAER